MCKYNLKATLLKRFWKALQFTGIRRSDPRLEKMVNNLNDIKNEAFGDTPLDSLELDRRQFKRRGLSSTLHGACYDQQKRTQYIS